MLLTIPANQVRVDFPKIIPLGGAPLDHYIMTFSLKMLLIHLV